MANDTFDFTSKLSSNFKLPIYELGSGGLLSAKFVPRSDQRQIDPDHQHQL